MSRFRYKGHNWAGVEFEVVNPLIVLGEQITELDSNRYLVDGTVAGYQHDQNDYRSDNKYTSDHSAFTDHGIIRALDFGGPDAKRFNICENIRQSGDARVNYVINEDRIFSSYPKYGMPAYTWREYKGPRHDNHSHVSTLATADVSMTPWSIGGPTMTTHEHTPTPDQLPREWADGVWEQWVEVSGTKNESRTWDFYREDLAWVYDRVVKPLEKRATTLENELAHLKSKFEEFERYHRHEQVIEPSDRTGHAVGHAHKQLIQVSEWTGRPKIPFK